MTEDSKAPAPDLLTERQRKIAELYDGGLGTTQKAVAAEIGVSRATVARELRRVNDLHNEWEATTNDPAPDIYLKAEHEPDLSLDDKLDYRPIFGGPPIISRSTAYRRTAKEWGHAPEQVDKPLHEFKIAERAINRALRAIRANGNKATPEAWAKWDQISDLLFEPVE